MSDKERIEFFDGIADKWDGWIDLDKIRPVLLEGLKGFGVKEGETVVDLGCGTGNLTAVLLEILGAGGRVVSVDFSPKMIAAASAKINDDRVSWICAASDELPLSAADVDRIICYSAWPHISDPQKTARELLRVLKPGGSLCVWHTESRKTINEIHANASPAIKADVLIGAAALSSLLESAGFKVAIAKEDDRQYLVSAAKPK